MGFETKKRIENFEHVTVSRPARILIIVSFFFLFIVLFVSNNSTRPEISFGATKFFFFLESFRTIRKNKKIGIESKMIIIIIFIFFSGR